MMLMARARGDGDPHGGAQPWRWMLIVTIQGLPVTTKQSGIRHTPVALPSAKEGCPCFVFRSGWSQSRAGRASRQVRGRQDGALDLVRWISSPSSRGSSPGIWLVETAGFCRGWCRAGRGHRPGCLQGPSLGEGAGAAAQNPTGPEPCCANGLLQHQPRMDPRGFQASPMKLLIKILPTTLYFLLLLPYALPQPSGSGRAPGG